MRIKRLSKPRRDFGFWNGKCSLVPSPLEGEGISSCISICLPSPLEGEGGVRGENSEFFTPSPSEGEGQGGGAKGTRGEVL